MSDILRDKNIPDDVIIDEGDFVINPSAIIQHYYDYLTKKAGVFSLNDRLGMNIETMQIDNEITNLRSDFIKQVEDDGQELNFNHLTQLGDA